MAVPVDESPSGAFPGVLRAWVDLVEAAEDRWVSPALDPEPISPELVLVDPALRCRLSELPTGPRLPPAVRVIELPAPAPTAPPEPSPGPGLVASVVYVCALVLALPMLAIAADLVRSGGPRLAPPTVAPSSGQVHVTAQKHVVTKPSRRQPVQANRPR